jgi:lipoprotein NlpI
VASIGLFYAFSTLFVRGIAGLPAYKRLCVIAILAILIALTARLTWKRCAVWKDSITLWSDVISTTPDVPRAYYNRALEYENRKQYDMALRDYSSNIALKNNDTEAYMARGIVYGKKGEFDRSIEDFNTVLKINPLYLKALMNRSISFYNKNDHKNAQADIQRLLAAGYPVDSRFIAAVNGKMRGKN